MILSICYTTFSWKGKNIQKNQHSWSQTCVDLVMQWLSLANHLLFYLSISDSVESFHQISTSGVRETAFTRISDGQMHRQMEGQEQLGLMPIAIS